MNIQRNRRSVEITPRAYDLEGLPTRYFHPGEIEVLMHLIESVAASVVIEFGVNNGRTPAAVLRNVQSITNYVGIDVTRDYRTIMPAQRKEIPIKPGRLAAHDPRFQLIVRRRGSFDLTPADLPQADVAFIDADHSRQGVMNDYSLARKVVRPGGIIVFHDDNCLPTVEVTQTLNDLCDEGREIVHVAGTWLAYERV
ncbi:MAG: class I SAM-dependent methyltransferase [Steroidobacteraceae bacterium]|nr:class I SAM-dependent methyltransferase [Steroidobacteraceae bacterium]